MTLVVVCIVREKISCVTLPEEELGPDGRHVPVLAENTSRVGLAADEMESDDSGGNGLSAAVVCQGVVLLVEARVWNRHTIDHSLVITKHPRWTLNGNT